ncbi:MAG: DUF1573 domain-containing protein [Phycisphaerales bacterium]|nr:DUF1573 domain-containing protein [Phycisphaerales bacterium]
MAIDRSQLTAMALGGLVALAGVAWLVTRPSDQASDVGSPESTQFAGPAAVAVEPSNLEFGELVPGKPSSRTVTVRNVTDREVRLSAALPSCGCTTVDWPRGPIPAGGTAEATVTMTAGDSQGERLVKSVAFLVQGASPTVIAVQGTVGMFVTCEPRMLEGPPEREASPAEGVVRLEAADGVPFRVIRVQPAIAAALPEGAAAEHSVAIDWLRWRALDRPDYVEITTDHPKAPTFTVTLRRSVRAPEPP